MEGGGGVNYSPCGHVCVSVVFREPVGGQRKQQLGSTLLLIWGWNENVPQLFGRSLYLD